MKGDEGVQLGRSPSPICLLLGVIGGHGEESIVKSDSNLREAS